MKAALMHPMQRIATVLAAAVLLCGCGKGARRTPQSLSEEAAELGITIVPNRTAVAYQEMRRRLATVADTAYSNFANASYAIHYPIDRDTYGDEYLKMIEAKRAADEIERCLDEIGAQSTSERHSIAQPIIRTTNAIVKTNSP
jgi:hypothetical protein